MAPWLTSLMSAGNVAFFRLAGQRMRIQGRPLLLLTTRGAKTGKRRQTTLGWFPDEPARPDTWLIVASALGAATHPGWYVNLARRPDDASIDVGGQHVAVEPRSLHGPERDRAWTRIVALAPGYGKYTEQTDREIPVVRLTRKP
ncbi:MAG: nitroreductase family deazaflavin-dependent oxidoreductase [Chloroflexota bacterium]